MIKNIKLLWVVGLLGFSLMGNSQDFGTLRLAQEIAGLTKGYFEGFNEKILPNNFSYHSFRHDLSASMLTRCEDKPSPMEWYTEKIPESIEQDRIGFLWIAAMNLTDQEAGFTVSLNGTPRFVIPVSSLADRTIAGDDGAFIRFLSIMKDRHGDGHGYMFMEVPVEWIEPGQKQVIRIEGSLSSSSTWIIVFDAQDALDYLRNTARFNAMARMELLKSGDDWDLNMTTIPPSGEDRILVKSGKKVIGEIPAVETGLASVTFSCNDRDVEKTITVVDPYGEILSWNPAYSKPAYSEILPNGVLKNVTVTRTEESVEVRSERVWMPGLINNLIKLSESNMRQSSILLMNSSHQDIAWMDTPEKCVVERDTMLLTPLFERAAQDPGYRFDVEDALMLKEFIQRHPGKKELVKELLADGRISCGAAFIQPYEEMYSGEALVRQLYFGKKWLKDEFDYEANTYWNVDVPGRTLQMPQILSKAGVKNMVMTRQELGFYDWYSPDGSKVRGFSNGHYSSSFNALSGEYYMAMDYIADHAFAWQKFYSSNQDGKIVPLLSDWDMSPAKDYSELLTSWNSVGQLTNNQGQEVRVHLPAFQEALAPDMFKAVAKANAKVVDIHGERPALWLYIHGPSHQKAMKISREADIKLTQAEKVAVINSLLSGTFNQYPERELKQAWEAKIYPDHGWGGNGGEITDAYFKSKYQFALAEADRILDKEMWKLGSMIKDTGENGRPVMVFNTLNWIRTSPATFQMSFAPESCRHFSLIDDQGQQVPIQVLHSNKDEQGFIDHAEFIFLAKDVPAIGYRTYRLLTDDVSYPVPMPKFGTRIENDFYIVELGKGGLSRIFDKAQQSELIEPGGFAAGEVFTLHSEGNGAGEFAQVQQPDMSGFDRTGNYSTVWKLTQDGPLFTAYTMRQPIRQAVVELTVQVYKEIKKIDFKIQLLNWEGVLYREFRMAMPIHGANGQVVYEVPYGKLVVGQDEMKGDAGERYTTPAKDIHPRAMQNWISVNQPDYGITMSSSVVAVDYLDMTGLAGNSTFIQPILLASRRSCHGLGNEYLQTGDHAFSFSLYSHEPGWQNGYRFGLEANEKLLVVTDYQSLSQANLPKKQSFFDLGDSSVLISVIKKAEDQDAVIMRGVEIEGKQAALYLDSYFEFKNIQPVNLIEESIPNQKKGQGFSFDPFAIETFKLK